MSTQEAQAARQQYAMQQGWLAGGVAILFFAVIYMVDKVLFLNPVLWWASTVIYFFFMYRAVQPAEDLTFRDNIRDPFLTFVLANGLFYLFYYLMLSFIDPVLQDIQWEMLQESGQLPDGATQEKAAPSFMGILLQYARSLIFGFGFAAAVTWIKRRQANLS